MDGVRVGLRHDFGCLCQPGAARVSAVCCGFGLPYPVLVSWLHSLKYVRNICAHYGRVWNRECRIKPMIARAYKAELTPNGRVYAKPVLMPILLVKIAPGNHWAI